MERGCLPLSSISRSLWDLHSQQTQGMGSPVEAGWVLAYSLDGFSNVAWAVARDYSPCTVLEQKMGILPVWMWVTIWGQTWPAFLTCSDVAWMVSVGLRLSSETRVGRGECRPLWPTWLHRRAQGELKMHLLHSQSLPKWEKVPSSFGRETWTCYWGVGAFLGGDGWVSPCWGHPDWFWSWDRD